MKLVQSIGVWGDSVMKGVVYDENKSKYTLLSENGADKASRKLGLRLFNRSRMGCTVTKGLQLLKKDLQRPEAACDAALIEFGGNDCDYDWAQVAAHPEQDHQPKTPLPLFIAQLRDMIEEHKASKEEQPLLLSKGEVRSVLSSCGVAAPHVDAFEAQYDQAFGPEAGLSPRNLVDPKQLEVRTPDVTIHVNPERSDLVETRMIEGTRYILIRANEGVEVNGVSIQIS